MAHEPRLWQQPPNLSSHQKSQPGAGRLPTKVKQRSSPTATSNQHEARAENRHDLAYHTTPSDAHLILNL
jgi:hypothetical protein